MHYLHIKILDGNRQRRAAGVRLGNYSRLCCSYFVRMTFLLANTQSRQSCHNRYIFKADSSFFADEAEDVLGGVGAVEVVDDVAALVSLHPILVDHPLQCRPVTQSLIAGESGFICGRSVIG